jgi:hypothetical protein
MADERMQQRDVAFIGSERIGRITVVRSRSHTATAAATRHRNL